MKPEKIQIKTDYIQLGQFLKLANIVDSGGSVKYFLNDYAVFVNGDQDQRRGKKLYPGDIIEVEEIGQFQIVKE
ncbi:MAG: S4 domain-containing protein YaaA [Amphibacillus sp.]|nr:S4 domain-containing protein YaaA [Amphibacillus sp.]